jgi:NitT/TauT family transport system ATP-binding protein
MSDIRLQGITKTFPARDGAESVDALGQIDLEQPANQFLCVMGPSGCGKSTLLNIIAGFEKPDAGRCLVGGRAIDGPGPDRGVVFQEYAVFPWMTVEENIAFALRAAGQSRGASRERAQAILDRLALAGFGPAYPKSLSGGMQQRVAIARVLAIDSPVMLMDEPFGALDALTRSALQEELVDLWRETRKTIFFVTHSPDEAVYLADRVVVMSPRPGRVICDIPIDLPRPRDVTGPRFNELKREILGVIAPILAQARAKAAGAASAAA